MKAIRLVRLAASRFSSLLPICLRGPCWIGLCISTSFFLQCANQDEGDDIDPTLFLLVALQYSAAGPSTTLMVNEALDSWRIGLPHVQFAATRSMQPGYAYSPANWMVVSDDSCTATGMPSGMAGANCPFPGTNVIGFCSFRIYSGSGQIADTTLVIRASYQNSNLASYARKRAVCIHEIGHCIGLAHTDDLAHVMYPYVTDTPAPHSVELAAAAEAYVPQPAAPSATTRDAFYFYYTNSSDATVTIRQFSLPRFYMPAPPNAFLDDSPEPLHPLTDDVEVRTIFFMADGTERLLVERHSADR